MNRTKSILSIFLCLFIFFANTNALCAKAAPLTKTDADKIAYAIDNTAKTQNAGSSGYYDNLKNGRFTFIKSFQISGLDAPQHGHLLDGTAIVTADNGFSWEIPVLWVNNDGDLVKVAIEVDESTRSYPVFAFYLPQGYALTFGEKSSYDIKVPDFVRSLFDRTGVATLSNPDRGITYITPLLPGKDRVLVRVPSNYYEEAPQCSGSVEGESEGGMPDNDDPCYPWPSVVDPDTLQYENYNPNFSADQITDIANRHGSPEAIAAIGADNVAWLVSYIKEVIEPEAVALLTSKFPAYAAAAANGELGRDLGVYIYYTDKEEDQAVAYVRATPDNSTGTVKYVLAVNSYYYYSLDGDALKSNPEFTDDSDIKLDTTMIHEIMHALMDDYTRTGMLGMQYVKEGDFYTYNEYAEFPEWFVEGIATSVGSPYQYWNSTLKSSYGYDGTSYSNLLEAYLDDEEMHLNFSDGKSLNEGSDIRKSAYVSGYLANVYLGYLAARKYDGLDAITEYENGDYSINSLVIRSGVNHILEELHKGKTLDDIIFEISDFGDTVLYLDTDDFANKFIASDDEGIADNGISLAFTTKFLNYLEGNSLGEFVANGSILTDFTDVSPTLLSADLLANPQTVLKLTESKEQVESTVDPLIALKSGGKSETGIFEEESSDKKLAAFPEKNIAMASSPSTDGPISASDKEDKALVSDTVLMANEQDTGTVSSEQDNKKDLKESASDNVIKAEATKESQSANNVQTDNAASIYTATINTTTIDTTAIDTAIGDKQEISSILDAIQTGIDEHNEMAETNDGLSNDPATTATDVEKAFAEETNASNSEAASGAQDNDNEAITAAASSEVSDEGTDGGESDESNEDGGNSDSDSDAITSDNLTAAQSISDAIAAGQTGSSTPEELTTLSDNKAVNNISLSDNTDSLTEGSREKSEKGSDTSDTADSMNQSSVQAANETSNVTASDSGSSSTDNSNTTASFEEQVNLTKSPDTAQEAESGKTDEAQDSQLSPADEPQVSEPAKDDGSPENQTAPDNSAQNDTSSNTQATETTQEAATETTETTQENGLTDSGSAVTIDELENTPVDISISASEPEADDTPENTQDDQQILDAMPVSDDSDSETDSASDTAPPVQ